MSFPLNGHQGLRALAGQPAVLGRAPRHGVRKPLLFPMIAGP